MGLESTCSVLQCKVLEPCRHNTLRNLLGLTPILSVSGQVPKSVGVGVPQTVSCLLDLDREPNSRHRAPIVAQRYLPLQAAAYKTLQEVQAHSSALESQRIC